MSSFLSQILVDHQLLSRQDAWNVYELNQIADNVHDVRRRQADTVHRLQSDEEDEEEESEEGEDGATDPVMGISQGTTHP